MKQNLYLRKQKQT